MIRIKLTNGHSTDTHQVRNAFLFGSEAKRTFQRRVAQRPAWKQISFVTSHADVLLLPDGVSMPSRSSWSALTKEARHEVVARLRRVFQLNPASSTQDVWTRLYEKPLSRLLTRKVQEEFRRSSHVLWVSDIEKVPPLTPTPSLKTRKTTSLKRSVSVSRTKQIKTIPPTHTLPVVTLRKDLWQYEEPTPLNGFFLLRKLNGIRAIWSGEAMFSRSGNVLDVPERIRQYLPTGIPLDGELAPSEPSVDSLAIAMTAYSKHSASQWDDRVQFNAFDVLLEQTPYRERRQYLEKLSRKHGFPVIAATLIQKKTQPQAVKQVLNALDRYVRQGGEGLVLRKASEVLRRHGRSSDIIKVKPLYRGMAEKVEFVPSKKRSVLKVISCHSPHRKWLIGQTFDHGTSSIVRQTPVGGRFRFVYTGVSYAGHVPLFPQSFQVVNEIP